MRSSVLLLLAAAASASPDCYKENTKVEDSSPFVVDVHGTSPNLCQLECRNEDGCTKWTFYRDTNQCWLSKGEGSFVESTQNRPVSGNVDACEGPAEPEAPAAIAPHAGDMSYGLVGAASGASEKEEKESSSSGDSLEGFGNSLDSTRLASSLGSSSLASLPKWAALLLFCLLLLALCGALAMAFSKPKKKKSKRGKKKTEEAAVPVVEVAAPMLAAPVTAQPIATYSMPVPAQYVQPQVVEYVQQPQVVEYVQQPQVVEYVQPVQTFVQGAPTVLA